MNLGLRRPWVSFLWLRSYTKANKMNIKDIISDGLVISLSAALLWHFSNIWRYGQHLIQEPNTIILSLETAGLLFILVFVLRKFISELNK